jgi:hypothetical protein
VELHFSTKGFNKRLSQRGVRQQCTGVHRSVQQLLSRQIVLADIAQVHCRCEMKADIAQVHCRCVAASFIRPFVQWLWCTVCMCIAHLWYMVLIVEQKRMNVPEERSHSSVCEL